MTWAEEVKSGGKFGGKKFSLYVLAAAQFGNKDTDGYVAYCKDSGLLPIGCGLKNSVYDCQQQLGQGKCVSMPENFGCLRDQEGSYLSYVRAFMLWGANNDKSEGEKVLKGKKLMALCAANVNAGYCDNYLAAQGADWKVTTAVSGKDVYPVCGQFTE